MIPEEQLRQLYLDDKLSFRQIAQKLGCSQHKVSYWMRHYALPRRSISDASYVKRHPGGDPFLIRPPKNQQEVYIKGLALGIFWKEGYRTNKYSIRVSSDQPASLDVFIKFLTDLCGVDKTKLRYGLHIFSDTSKNEAIKFWSDALQIKSKQFHKVTVRSTRGAFQNNDKNRYGILTLYFHNKKLRDIIVGMLPS